MDWLCSAVSYLATKKGSIACGICAPKEFVMHVMKTKSLSLPFSPGESGFLVAAHLHITDPNLFSLKPELVHAQISSVTLYTCCHFTCQLGNSV